MAGEDAAARIDQKRLLLLVEDSLDFLEFISAGGRIQSVTKAITALAGYSPSEIVGRRFSDFLHPDDRSCAEDALKVVMRDGNAGPVQLRYCHQTGTYRTVLVTARNFLEDPDINGILLLTRDITDQLEAKADLRLANAELRDLSNQLIISQESERNHLARELHDDVQQILAGLRYSMAASARPDVARPSAYAVGEWDSGIAQVIEHLRRLTLQLRPPDLESRGLGVAVQEYITVERSKTATEIKVDIAVSVGRMPAEVELASFRIIQESLTNALRHGRPAHVCISANRSAVELTVKVVDDGSGFDVAAAGRRAAGGGRVGLMSIRERARSVGGSAVILSTPGGGCDVSASFPIGPFG